MPATVQLLRDSYPDEPALDTAALHRAVLEGVAAGRLGPCLRLHWPGPVLAFSRQDRAADGYDAAVAEAVRHGYAPVQRLPGGRAAVFHEETLSLALTEPDNDARLHIHERFSELAEVVTEALRTLGIDARVGQVPDEYGPGRWSLNARGETKLVGIGQRIISGAAHTGAVLVAGGADRIRDVLIPVYEALELEFAPATVGSVGDEGAPATPRAVEDAVLGAFEGRLSLTEGTVDPATLARGRELAAAHQIPGRA
ncbi:MAG: lipoate--protein ligase family protein [Solirubrobacterales bacterium]